MAHPPPMNLFVGISWNGVEDARLTVDQEGTDRSRVPGQWKGKPIGGGRRLESG